MLTNISTNKLRVSQRVMKIHTNVVVRCGIKRAVRESEEIWNDEFNSLL